MMGGPVRFILAESGHIAGIINHPAKKNAATGSKREDAQMLIPTSGRRANKNEGSWWLDWVPWLDKKSGEQIEPPAMGNEEHTPMMDAPGSYVLEK